MPLGPTHEKIQIGVALVTTTLTPLALIATDVSIEKATTIFLAAFLGSTSSIVLTPDLIDVDGDTLPERRIRGVPILGWITATIYDGISLLIPHRGISHVPVIGSIITLFVPWFLILPLAWFDYIPWSFVLWLVAFKSLADMFHIIPDSVVTFFRKSA